MKKLSCNVEGCALVFEGGGYRAAYTAGIARVLLEQGIHFPFVCGISAGSSHTVDYCSRDLARTRNAFLGMRPEGIPIAGFGSVVRGKGYFNADYLYEGCIADGFMPFDWDTFQANPAQVAIQAFEVRTGRSVTFTKDDMRDKYDMVDKVRASSTLPGVMHPKAVDGRLFMDGGLGEGAGLPLHLAERGGYDRFFFVATRPHGYRKEPPTEQERRVYRAIAHGRPYLLDALLTRWERYNRELTRIERLADEGRCLIVYPDDMPICSGTTDKARLLAAYNEGHAQAMRDLPRYREFLFGAPDAGPHPDEAALARTLAAIDDGYVIIEG